MKEAWKGGIMLVAMAIVTAPAYSSAPIAAYTLLEARLTKVENVTDEPGAPRLCADEARTICVDGAYRTTFSIDRTLIGPPVNGQLSRTQASARPRLNLSYYLVVSHVDGASAIEWLGLTRNGLCMDVSDAQRFGLMHFAKRHPCHPD